MTLTADPRYELMPAEQWIPITLGPNAGGKSKPTVYRWAQKSLLKLLQTADGTLVQIGSLREAEATMKPGRKFTRPNKLTTENMNLAQRLNTAARS
jgi:hypothetical protein